MAAAHCEPVESSRSASRIAACACLLVAALVPACGEHQTARGPESQRPTQSLYDGKLSAGWQDWGWGAHDLAHGAAKINFAEYGGWIIHHDRLSDRFGALTFRMLAPAANGDFLQVQLADGEGDNSQPMVDIGPEHESALPGSWIFVSIPWQELNPTGRPFDRVKLHARKPVSSDWVQLDELVLTPSVDGPGAPSTTLASTAPTTPRSLPEPGPADPAAKQVRLSVDCRAAGHPISPYIYGIAGDNTGLFATARRWGGNPTTRYNWQLATAYNAGKDWYFENQKALDYRVFLSGNLTQQLMSALTVPMIGWVAKDTTSAGFPSSIYGAQRGHDPYRPDLGDGVRPSGEAIAPKSPLTTSVEAPPDTMQKWVEAIHDQDKRANTHSVGLYILDNEPSLWNSTHRDVHPEPLSYDELLDRTLRYGAAIRTADPNALIAGPAEWGWLGYFYSAKDAAAGVALRPDRRAHGDVPLIPWYLKKLNEHARETGKRVLDVLDVHFYPQAQGVYGDAADAATAALRLRSTRSLWDPTYKDESWINDTIRLVPRLKEWVQQNYPGLAISIGEYNFGGEKDISGALALAEVLGRFGTTGVDYAFYWMAPPKDSPAYWAFRAYRNFDGKNGRFLNRSVDTQMDPEVSLFASRDETGKHLVLIALNMNATSAAAASIDLSACGELAGSHEYTYGAGAKSLSERKAADETAGTLHESFAPYSINVLDITLK
ncbi:MAG TPA: glycoside hydrolase family 44 protein, partial [Polyangiaceae bacterium]|jgi:hypothetical protein|nr:glycoside hydrolase family 44 protein [Polyangiaceae bacterium]